MRNDKLSELFDRVQNVPCPTREVQELGNILCQLIEEVQGMAKELEATGRIAVNAAQAADKANKTASRAANTASCLANGIQPD